MIRPVLTELLLFAVPFALYAVFLWAHRVACYRGVVAGARQLPVFRTFHRRAARLDLRSGAHGKRQIRAGDDKVSGDDRP
jgi:hypothetical protein